VDDRSDGRERDVRQLIVARHGDSEYSARGLLNGDPRRRCPLTATGREQARRLGKLLSEFERTKETADIALVGREIPRLVVPELNDHPAGAYEGRGIAEYLEWAHGASSTELIPGTAETRADVADRFARGYRLLLERPEQAIVAILHSLPISYLLSGPRRILPLLGYAEPAFVSAADARAAVERLERWAASPTW
jgi:broad specificity phosphatase PhoE